MTGSSIFDYVHQSDHLELAEQLGVSLAHQPKINTAASDPDKDINNQNLHAGGSPAIPDG